MMWLWMAAGLGLVGVLCLIVGILAFVSMTQDNPYRTKKDD